MKSFSDVLNGMSSTVEVEAIASTTTETVTETVTPTVTKTVTPTNPIPTGDGEEVTMNEIYRNEFSKLCKAELMLGLHCEITADTLAESFDSNVFAFDGDEGKYCEVDESTFRDCMEEDYIGFSDNIVTKGGTPPLPLTGRQMVTCLAIAGLVTIRGNELSATDKVAKFTRLNEEAYAEPTEPYIEIPVTPVVAPTVTKTVTPTSPTPNGGGEEKVISNSAFTDLMASAFSGEPTKVEATPPAADAVSNPLMDMGILGTAFGAVTNPEKPIAQRDDKTVQEVGGQVIDALMQQLEVPAQACALSLAILGNLDLVDTEGKPLGTQNREHLKAKIAFDYSMTLIESEGEEVPVEPLSELKMFDALVNAKLITKEAAAGKMLRRLMEEDRVKNYPTLAGETIVPLKPHMRLEDKASPLALECIDGLQTVEFMKNDRMVGIAVEVDGIKVAGHPAKDALIKLKKETYVLQGLLRMESDTAYVGEFGFDTRFRMYQWSVHGACLSGGSRTRACTDYAGVGLDYDLGYAVKSLVAEMKEMGKFKDVAELGQQMEACNSAPALWITTHLADPESCIKDKWGFCKLSHLLVEVSEAIKGNAPKPYIGIGFGLDAKCSGPQIGALISGDHKMLRACGFSMVAVEDAYTSTMSRAIKAGFTGLTRDLVKGIFMAVFYGQGPLGLVGRKFERENPGTTAIMQSFADDKDASVPDACHKIHQCVTRSFGMRLTALRKAFADHGFKYDEDGNTILRTKGPVSYMTGDGCRVQMDYPTELSITGEPKVKTEEDLPPTTIKSGLLKLSLGNPTFMLRRLEDTAAHSRKGFVNFVQQVDGLIARMICVNLLRQGVRWITSIHDCFRVCIHDQDKLVKAVRETYMTLFGDRQMHTTDDLPLGNDLLGLYFEGANKALLEGEKETDLGQFFGDSGRRNNYMVGDATLAYLIDQLGISYYFSK
jgi:hypothetical protein